MHPSHGDADCSVRSRSLADVLDKNDDDDGDDNREFILCPARVHGAYKHILKPINTQITANITHARTHTGGLVGPVSVYCDWVR